MRLNEIASNDKQLDEILPILPALGAVAGGVARGAAMAGGAALRAVPAIARGVGSAVSQGAKAVSNVASQGAKAVGNVVSKGANVAGQIGRAANVAGQIGRAANLGGLEGGATDPAAQAQQVAVAKKEVQDQIKQKQAELQALQQQLTQIK
jgi:hypothetical protein